MKSNFNKKVKTKEVDVNKNFNLKKEYGKSLEYNKTHFTSTTKNGIMYCVNKYSPDVVFAMLV